MVGMPIKTQEGYKVLCYRLSDSDPSKVNFANAVKAFCMFNDVMISQDGIIEGYIVVFDMKGLRLGHLAKIQLGPLRTFMAYIQVSLTWILSNRKPLVLLRNMHLMHSSI